MPPPSVAPAMGDPKNSPVPPPLRPLPKVKPDERKLRLQPDRWAGIDEAAEFQTAAFELAGAEEKYSRNDMADFLLEWALKAFWEERGGKPSGADDRQAKLEREAATLKVEMEKRLAQLRATSTPTPPETPVVSEPKSH